MIVKAYYSGGRIDVFDTDRMTDGIPQPGNLLTNYTLDLSDVNGESLWLRSYYYEAVDAYKDELGPKGLPVARRRDGWSFLLADAEDMQRLNRVTVDGETVLVQIAGELVDAAALAWAYDCADVYAPKAIVAFGHLSRVARSDQQEAEVFELMGLSPDVYNVITSIASCNNASHDDSRF